MTPDPRVGSVAGAVAVVLVVAALVPFRDDLTLAGPALALVLPVVVGGLVGGRGGALATAVVATAALNLAFIPPYWTFQIEVADDVVALVVFGLVGLAVGSVVAREASRRRAAEDRARELEEAERRNRALQEERAVLLEEAGRIEVLEQIDEQRAALLRSVSHDLRTPLATVQAVISSLREGTEYDPATRTELLDLVGDEVERLDRIVANLLSLSRIEAGALHPSRDAVALDELITACAARLSRLVHDHRLELDVRPGLPLVHADYSQIDQVVSNLLENGVRHTPEGSTIRVSAVPRGAMVEVSVGDDGPGVLGHEVRRLFEPYRRGDLSRADPGTSSGVGLAICKAIVEAHGGTIGVGRSELGGAKFTFTLPVYQHHG